MDLSNIKPVPDYIIKAIGNTLIHSLWQGLLLAAIAGLVIVCTRRSTSNRRYNLLIAALALFAAATVGTFLIEFNHAPANNIAMAVYKGGIVNSPTVSFNENPVQKVTVADAAMGYINRNAGNIVMIWFLIVCARSLQLFTGLYGLYHYRRKSLFPVEKAWRDRVQELAVKLGISQIVGIAESGLAKVPMVIGHLKPLILIPAGLITAMPPEEIEAILIHELAHIRRRDYLVNLLQNLLEIVFFFNPAVLWLSALIKAERENCCDDIAVAQTSSKVNYIRALVSCQEYQLQAPAYAMALRSSKGNLKDRVKRILSNNNQSLNLIEKSLLAVCLVTAGLLTAAFSNADKINKLVTSATKAITHVAGSIKKEQPAVHRVIADTNNEIKPLSVLPKDTLKGKFKIFNPDGIGEGTSLEFTNKGFTTYLHKADGVLYQLNFKSGSLNSVQVDGKTLSPAELAANKPEIDKIIMKHDKQLASLKQKIEMKPLSPATSTLAINTGKLGQMDLHLSDSLQKLNATTLRLNEQNSLAMSDSVNQAYKKASLRGAYQKPATPLYSYPYKNVYKPYAVSGSDDERRKQAIDDMVKEGIISTRDNLSFKLSTEEFIVNGKKQPDDVYQRYRAKYVKITGHNQWSWYYNYDTAQRRETNNITDSDKK